MVCELLGSFEVAPSIVVVCEYTVNHFLKQFNIYLLLSAYFGPFDTEAATWDLGMLGGEVIHL